MYKKSVMHVQKSLLIARDQKRDENINRMFITTLICIQWKFSTPDQLAFAN